MNSKIAVLTLTLTIFSIHPNLFSQQKDSIDYLSRSLISGAEYHKNAGSNKFPEKEEILLNMSISPKKDKVILITPIKKRLSLDSDEYFIIWIADITTGQLKILVKSKEKDVGISNPKWSPDGKWIAFQSFSIGGHSPLTTLQTWLIDTSGVNLIHVALPSKYKNFSNTASHWENEHLLIIETTLDKKKFQYDCDSQSIHIIQ